MKTTRRYRTSIETITRATATAGLFLALTACGMGLDTFDETTDDSGGDDGAARVCDSGTDLVFASNLENDTIQTYSLNRSDSTATLVATYRYPTEEDLSGLIRKKSPFRMVTNAAGTRLYVANGGTMQNWNDWGDSTCSVGVFDINHDTGELTPIAGSPFYVYEDASDHDVDDDGTDDIKEDCSFSSVALNHDESVLMTGGGEQGDNAVFSVDASTGALTHTDTLGGNSGHNILLHPTEDIFFMGAYPYTVAGDGSVTQGSYDSSNFFSYWTDAVMRVIDSKDLAIQVRGNNNLRVADVTDPGSVSNSSIYLYRETVDGSGTSDDYTDDVKDFALTADNSILFASDETRDLVLTYQMDWDAGTATPINTAIDNLYNPRSTRLSSDEGTLIVASFGGSALGFYSVSPDDHSLTPVDLMSDGVGSRTGIVVLPNQCD